MRMENAYTFKECELKILRLTGFIHTPYKITGMDLAFQDVIQLALGQNNMIIMKNFVTEVSWEKTGTA